MKESLHGPQLLVLIFQCLNCSSKHGIMEIFGFTGLTGQFLYTSFVNSRSRGVKLTALCSSKPPPSHNPTVSLNLKQIMFLNHSVYAHLVSVKYYS